MPEPLPESPKSNLYTPLLILLPIVVIFGFIFYYQLRHPDFSLQKFITDRLSPAPTSLTLTADQTPKPKPSHEPYPLIPNQGGTSGTYIVSQGQHNGPTFKEITFQPLDVAKGEKLTITVTLDSSTAVIDSLTGVFKMDDSQNDIAFNKVSSQGLSQKWETSFILSDTVSYRYMLFLTAVDSSGESTMSLAPRSE